MGSKPKYMEENLRMELKVKRRYRKEEVLYVAAHAKKKKTCRVSKKLTRKLPNLEREIPSTHPRDFFA